MSEQQKLKRSERSSTGDISTRLNYSEKRNSDVIVPRTPESEREKRRPNRVSSTINKSDESSTANDSLSESQNEIEPLTEGKKKSKMSEQNKQESGQERLREMMKNLEKLYPDQITHLISGQIKDLETEEAIEKLEGHVVNMEGMLKNKEKLAKERVKVSQVSEMVELQERVKNLEGEVVGNTLQADSATEDRAKSDDRYARLSQDHRNLTAEKAKYAATCGSYAEGVRSMYTKIGGRDAERINEVPDPSEISEVFDELDSRLLPETNLANPAEIVARLNAQRQRFSVGELEGSETESYLNRELTKVSEVQDEMFETIAMLESEVEEKVKEELKKSRLHLKKYSVKVAAQLDRIKEVRGTGREEENSESNGQDLVGAPGVYEISAFDNLKKRIEYIFDSVSIKVVENIPQDESTKKSLIHMTKTMRSSITKKLETAQKIRNEFIKDPAYKSIIGHRPAELKSLDGRILELEQKVQVWEEKLDEQVRKKELDIISRNTVLPTMQCIKFSGYSCKIDVYSFLEDLERILGDQCTNEASANLLFNNYLSEEVQNVLNNEKDNYENMKKKLLTEFGNPNKLVQSRVEQVKKLKLESKSAKSRVKYWGSFIRDLEALQSLITKHGAGLESEIYHREVVVKLIASTNSKDEILDYIHEKEKKIVGRTFTSQEQFEQVVKFAKDKVARAKLEMALTDEKEPEPVIGVNTIEMEDQLQTQIVQLQTSQQTTLPAQSTQPWTFLVPPPWKQAKQQQNKEREERDAMTKRTKQIEVTQGLPLAVRQAIQAGVKKPCFMCEVQSHCYSACPVFLSATAKARAKKADTAIVCKCCFSPECYNNWLTGASATRRCGKPEEAQVICQPCQTGGGKYKGKPYLISAWLCEIHGAVHQEKREEIKKKMKELYPSDPDIVELNCLMIQEGIEMNATGTQGNMQENLEDRIEPATRTHKEVCGMTGTQSQTAESGANPTFAFDVKTGEKVPVEVLMEKGLVRKKKTKPGVYFCQYLNLGGENTMCLFDSGCTIDIVDREVARKSGMKCVDGKQQVLSAAGNKKVTGKGKFEATLGPDAESGEYYQMELVGMEEISAKIPIIDLTSLQLTVKETDSKNLKLLSNEKMPTQIGGKKTGLVIGMKDGFLQPHHIYNFSNGLIVAKSRFRDIFGSRIVFGGSLSEEAFQSCTNVSEFRKTHIDLMKSILEITSSLPDQGPEWTRKFEAEVESDEVRDAFKAEEESQVESETIHNAITNESMSKHVVENKGKSMATIDKKGITAESSLLKLKKSEPSTKEENLSNKTPTIDQATESDSIINQIVNSKSKKCSCTLIWSKEKLVAKEESMEAGEEVTKETLLTTKMTNMEDNSPVKILEVVQAIKDCSQLSESTIISECIKSEYKAKSTIVNQEKASQQLCSQPEQMTKYSTVKKEKISTQTIETLRAEHSSYLNESKDRQNQCKKAEHVENNVELNETRLIKSDSTEVKAERELEMECSTGKDNGETPEITGVGSKPENTVLGLRSLESKENKVRVPNLPVLSKKPDSEVGRNIDLYSGQIMIKESSYGASKSEKWSTNEKGKTLTKQQRVLLKDQI